MENLQYYLTVSAIYLAVLAYLVWRVRADIRHKQPLGQTATWLIYMVPYGVVGVIGWFTPPWPRALSIAALVVWILVCGFISYQVHSRYNKWLDAEREKEKYQG